LLEDAVVVLVVVGVVDEPVAVGVVPDEIGVPVVVHVDEDLDAVSLRTDEGGLIPMPVAIGVDVRVVALRRRELLGALDRFAERTLPGRVAETAPGCVTQPAPGCVTQPAPGPVTQPAPGRVTQAAPGRGTQPAALARLPRLV